MGLATFLGVRKYGCCSVVAKASTAVMKHIMIVKLSSVCLLQEVNQLRDQESNK